MHNETIWRYLDFTKFVDLLTSKSLYFCRSDKFEDPFEGSAPLAHVKRRSHSPTSPIPASLQTGFEPGSEALRRYAFISCWHINEFESAALWRLYLKSNEGVAIRSTRKRLINSFKSKTALDFVVPVMYIDYANDDPPVPSEIAPFRYKRKSFEHEKELRAIVLAPSQDAAGEIIDPPSEPGLLLPVHLNRLIDEIYVSPTAPLWFMQLVKSVSKKFNIRATVHQSCLEADRPHFI